MLQQHGEIGHAAIQHRLEPLKSPGQQGHGRQRRADPSSFDHRVHAAVAQIPAGRLATYGQIAELIGAFGCARQVGWALRRLPLPSAVPWHRVVNAQGRISMSPGREGSDWMQIALLRAEGIPVDAGGRLPLRRYLWNPELPSVDASGDPG
ncbi:MAG: methylated-DNA--[protein]-cysteine S-methyltransferase [Cyanobacteria bacterium M_surface_9_m1_291]|nr:methylated-DNA--[protein]-cysteine S-methyltransferase [Cyanobacteria bacterium M_surface_9_m1_291]